MKCRARVWKLKDRKTREISGEVEQEKKREQVNATEVDGFWGQMWDAGKKVAQEACWMTTGNVQTERETWWWNVNVQEATA